MRRTDAIIIGGGQAGLAMSRCLSDRGIDHVVLERGRIAERWRSERWDSLRLLTPNWQSRLPGWRYRGPDPDGYMTMPEVTAYLQDYAKSFSAPVLSHTRVLAVTPSQRGYRVATDRGVWQAANVVVATGDCDVPFVPLMSRNLRDDFAQIVPTRYRNPERLPPGGVLIVGASASGVQIADELRRAGREVVLSVGRHTRLPRTHRGRDIMWWLDAMGLLRETDRDVYDLEASRRQPSMQLVGREDRADLDLAVLQRNGVRLVGRTTGIEGTHVDLAADLESSIGAAQAKLRRLMARIEAFVQDAGAANFEPATARPDPIRPSPSPRRLDLRAEGISTVIWATGFRRSYPWLQVGVLDARGEIRHQGGVTPAPGLYVLGLRFLRRRNSNFIDGVGEDARFLSADIATRLQRRRLAA